MIASRYQIMNPDLIFANCTMAEQGQLSSQFQGAVSSVANQANSGNVQAIAAPTTVPTTELAAETSQPTQVEQTNQPVAQPTNDQPAQLSTAPVESTSTAQPTDSTQTNSTATAASQSDSMTSMVDSKSQGQSQVESVSNTSTTSQSDSANAQVSNSTTTQTSPSSQSDGFNSQLISLSTSLSQQEAISDSIKLSEIASLSTSVSTTASLSQSESAQANSTKGSMVDSQSTTTQTSQSAETAYRNSVSTSLADLKNQRATPAVDVVDVSSHNGNLSVQDFTRMKEQGVKAVIVKVTEGTTYQNPMAKSQIANAQAAGLQTAVYHYSWYKNQDDARAEANYFADTAQSLGLGQNTLMVDDLEQSDTRVQNVTANAAAFNQALKDRGFQNTAIYSGPEYIRQTGLNFDFIGQDRVWIAQWPANPSSSVLLHPENGMWQWTTKATFDGVRGAFDGSILYNPSLFNGSGISTTAGSVASTVNIDNFKSANNHYVLQGTMTVNDVQFVNGMQQVRINELTAEPFDWTDNGVPTSLLENVNGSSTFNIGDRVKFKSVYAQGNISHYDVASDAIGVDYPNGIGTIWYSATKAWNHA